MDLIYTNEAREDIGVLLDYSLDLAFGADENNFELKISLKNNVITPKSYIYMEGTEYGGIIDTIKVDTSLSEIIYKGRTFHGILNSKIICPDSGQDYYTVSGDANVIIETLLTRLGLSSLFSASTDASDIMVTNYSFDRYIPTYDGIAKMLKRYNAKLKVVFKQGLIVLSAEKIIDYSQDDEFDSDQVKMTIEKHYSPTNHLICLGTGELADRQVINLYVDENGDISETQTITGLDEIASVYDYSSVESLEELRKGGIEKLQEEMSTGNTDLELNTTNDYDIGDIVGVKEYITGVSVQKPIVKKIVNVTKDIVKVEYKVGD